MEHDPKDRIEELPHQGPSRRNNTGGMSPPPLMLINTSGSQNPGLNSNVDSGPLNNRQRHGTSNQFRRKKNIVYSFEQSLNKESSCDYPRFIVLRAVEGAKPLSRCCLFAVNSEFRSACDAPKQMWAQNDGSIVVEVSSLQQYQKVCALTSLGGSSLNYVSHPTLNVTKGVIFSRKLLEFGYTEEKLKNELGDQKVTAVHHVHRNLNGNRIPTATYIISFSTAHLPDKIIMGYEPFYIKPFVSKPRRCNKCQRFGHIQKTCRWEAVCCNCAQSPQHGINCSNAACCANCGGSHAASSPSCIKYKFESDILAMRDNDKISFQEARRRVRARFIRPNLSYAEALASSHPPYSGKKTKTFTKPSESNPNMHTITSKGPNTMTLSANTDNSSTSSEFNSIITVAEVHSIASSSSGITHVTLPRQMPTASTKYIPRKTGKNTLFVKDSSASSSKMGLETIDSIEKYIQDTSQAAIPDEAMHVDLNTSQNEPNKRCRDTSPTSSPIGKRIHNSNSSHLACPVTPDEQLSDNTNKDITERFNNAFKEVNDTKLNNDDTTPTESDQFEGFFPLDSG